MSRNEYYKQWREVNKEKVKEYRMKYYDENRESILEKQKEKGAVALYKQDYRECECGKIFKASYFYTHRKKHCPKNKDKDPYINSLLLDKPICLEAEL